MENIQAIAQLTSAGAEGYGAYQQGMFQEASGKWSREQADFNARMMNLQAVDAERRGEITARQVESKGRQTIGAQRAALAAQGVDVGTGSAADVQAETAFITSTDASTVRANSWREAWGLRTQASDTEFQGKMKEQEGKNQAGATFLTGGLRASAGVLGAYDSYKKTQRSEDVPKTAKASTWERKAWERWGGQ